jgi:hypothetical protein
VENIQGLLPLLIATGFVIDPLNGHAHGNNVVHIDDGDHDVTHSFCSKRVDYRRSYC